MQIQMEIGFSQLIKVVRGLSKSRLQRLKAEIDRASSLKEKSIDLEALLLNGPTATKNQLAIISENRKAINQWRTK